MTNLRVGWIGDDALGNRIGVTLLPGRRDPVPNGQQRNLAEDLRVLRDAGVSRVMLLSPRIEVDELGVPDLRDRLMDLGIITFWRPMAPHSLPSLDALHEVVARIQLTGGPMVIVSRAGLERACMAAAAWRVAEEDSIDEAVKKVRRARGQKALRDAVQLRLLRRFEHRIRAATTSGQQAPYDWLPNDELTPESVPMPDDLWSPLVSEFGLSFNGYAYAGSPEGLRELVEEAERHWTQWRAYPRELTLSDFRAMLFYKQRELRWASQEYGPDEEFPLLADLAQVRRLVVAIRRIVVAR